MNKKLYLDWLKNKTNDTPIDGPNKLNESRTYRRQIRFMQNVIANLLDRGREEAKKKKDEEPETVSVEPRSSLVDLNLQKRDPAKSISIPQAAPSWSYNVKNALGLGTNSVYEEKIDENAIVLAKTAGSAMPVAGKILAKTPKSTPVVARRIVPAARRIGSNPNAIVLKPPVPAASPNAIVLKPPVPAASPNAINVLAKPPVPAARRIGSNPLARPVRQIGSQLGKSVATTPKIGPGTPEESAIVKPVGTAGPDGGLGKSNSRKPSSTTKSVHNRPNPYSAVTLKPETGEIEGGVQSGSVYEQALPKPSSGKVRTGNPISTTGSAIRKLTRIPLKLEENSMSSLINNHIEKFLKSRHGQKLKTEAESVLTKKD